MQLQAFWVYTEKSLQVAILMKSSIYLRQRILFSINNNLHERIIVRMSFYFFLLAEKLAMEAAAAAFSASGSAEAMFWILFSL